MIKKTFTRLMEIGHDLFIAKHMKRRKFGKCAGCEKPTLLLEYVDPIDTSVRWPVCETCFTSLQNQE